MSAVLVVLHVEGAGLGATLCPFSVSSVLPDRKLLAVSWLEGDLRECDNAELVNRIEELSRRVEALSTERNRRSSRDRRPSSTDRHCSPRNGHSSTKNRRPYNKSPTRHDAATTSCWYHLRFGARAQNCTQPCAFLQQGNPAQPASAAAHVCVTTTGRIFVTDKSSKQRFLIDTGSDLCEFPHKLVPRRRECVSYDLCVSNGTTIPTYGWLPLSLNLGLRRDFTWRFVVADVTHPLIWADFLSHFGLLVDCRNNRLLDGVTSLSAPAQPASSAIPSVKVISGGTAVDSILSEFPDLTRPTGVQREVRHNTVHHIRTVPGPPATCRPRRLAPDRLTNAKAEFEAMVRDGTARRSESSWSSALHAV
jgi:hypothetical protein